VAPLCKDSGRSGQGRRQRSRNTSWRKHKTEDDLKTQNHVNAPDRITLSQVGSDAILSRCQKQETEVSGSRSRFLLKAAPSDLIGDTARMCRPWSECFRSVELLRFSRSLQEATRAIDLMQVAGMKISYRQVRIGHLTPSLNLYQ